jgi:hypothetical protein
MGLELSDDQILYKGKAVGRIVYDGDNGRARIVLDVEFNCDPGEQILPLTAFSRALTRIEGAQPSGLLTVTTAPEDIIDESGPQPLLEQIVKLKPNKWNFHKSDKDAWPSPLHGHDYDKNLKLDAITGEIYDATSRTQVGKLRSKKLMQVQDDLRGSKDFKEPVERLVDRPKRPVAGN